MYESINTRYWQLVTQSSFKLLIECDARRMGLVWLPRFPLGAMATDSVLPKPLTRDSLVNVK